MEHYHDRATARITVWLTPEDGVEEGPYVDMSSTLCDVFDIK